LLKCRQTPRECLTFVRLTQKNVIADYFFKFLYFVLEMISNDFVEYDGRHDLMIHDMLWFYFWNYMICLHGCMDAWVEFAFFTLFLIWEQGKQGLEARKKTRLEARQKWSLGASWETELGD